MKLTYSDTEKDTLYNLLVKKHYQSIYIYCYKNLYYNIEEAKDCTQDTFLILYMVLPSIENINNVRSWLYKTANNYINRQIRQNARKKGRTVPIHTDTQTEFENHYVSIDYINLIFDNRVNIRDYTKTLFNQLSSNEYNLWELYYKQQRSISEICDLLNITSNCATSRIYRLKNKITKLANKFIKQNEDSIYSINF